MAEIDDKEKDQGSTALRRFSTRAFDHIVIVSLIIMTLFIGTTELMSGHYWVFILSIFTLVLLLFLCFSRPLFLLFEDDKVKIRKIIGSKAVNYEDIEFVKVQRMKDRKGDNKNALILILMDGTKIYLGSNFRKPSEEIKTILDQHLELIEGRQQ